MEPKTQSAGALQPPGRVPPVATATATPVPPPGPRPVRRWARPRLVGRWAAAIVPVSMIMFGGIAGAAASNDKLRVGGLLLFGVGFFLTGLFIGSGHFRAPREPWERPPYSE